jgi:hypothetical protein
MTDQLIITNPKIVEFYKKNPSLDFQSINLHLVDMLENIISDSENKLSSSSVTRLFSMLDTYNNKLDTSLKTLEQSNNTLLKQIDINKSDFKENIQHIRELIINQKNDIENSISSKLSSIKQQYIDDIKVLLQLIEHNTVSSISSKLESYNSTFIDKLYISINNLLPQISEPINKQLQNNIELFKNTLLLETVKLQDIIKNGNNTELLNSFVQNINNRYTEMVKNINDPIINYITSTEDRLQNNINTVRDRVDNNNNLSEQVNKNLIEHLNKFKSSTTKGQLSENRLFNDLTRLYTDAEITNTTSINHSGDILFLRNNKPSIRFENKDYTYNVPEIEIEKFKRDLNECNDSHGIFISQSSGIANRQDWSIEKVNNYVILFIHNANYDLDKLILAVKIIDLLDSYTSKNTEIIDNNNHYKLTEIDIIKLNEELVSTMNTKNKLLTKLEDYYKDSKKLITDDFKLSFLETIIKNSVYQQPTEIVCDYCTYKTTNKHSLAMHIHHRHKKQINITTDESKTEDNDEQNSPTSPNTDGTSDTTSLSITTKTRGRKKKTE